MAIIKNKNDIAVLSTKISGNLIVIVGVNENISKKIQATDIIKFIIQDSGGKGGGNGKIAQLGIVTNRNNLGETIKKLKAWLKVNIL